MTEIDTFGAYVRAELEHWGREFALHRDMDYLGHQSKNMLQVLIEHRGEMPPPNVGYKPLETDLRAHGGPMNSLAAGISGTVEKVPAGLEEKLQWLRRFGKPRLTFHADGWCGVIEMHVAATGAEFTVRSEFKHATPTKAVDQCIERMLESLALIAKGGS